MHSSMVLQTGDAQNYHCALNIQPDLSLPFLGERITLRCCNFKFFFFAARDGISHYINLLLITPPRTLYFHETRRGNQ